MPVRKPANRPRKNAKTIKRLPKKTLSGSRIGNFVSAHAQLGTPRETVFDMVCREYLARKGFDKSKAKIMADFFMKKYYDIYVPRLRKK